MKGSTAKTDPVKPCLVFPGWFVEPMSKEVAQETWVLNPKALPSFIGNEPVRVQEEDLHLGAYHLSRSIRSPRAEDDGAFVMRLLARNGKVRTPAAVTR